MRTQIKIRFDDEKLNNERWYLSLVEINEPGYYAKELALVEETPRGFMSVSCVPLCLWFLDSIDECETTIDLHGTIQSWGYDTEMSLIWSAMLSAQEYIRHIRRREIVREFADSAREVK